MHYERNQRWNAWSTTGERKPHGGFVETLAKGVYFAIIVAMIASFVKHRQATLKPVATHEQNMAAINRSNQILDEYMSNDQTLSPERVVLARNELVHLIDSRDATLADWAINHLRSVMDLTVGKTLRDLDTSMVRATSTEERFKVMAKRDSFYNELTMRDPYDGKGVGYGSVSRGLWKLTKAVIFAYGLFIPFALICFGARLVKNGNSLLDEFMFGKRELFISLLFWPFGMSFYPEGSALALRRSRIEAEYRIRKGLSFSVRLSVEQWSEIEALVVAPKEELVARLNAICVLPWHLVLKAKFAFCVSLFVGFLFSAGSFGRGSAYAAEVVDEGSVATQVVPPENKPTALAVSGFASTITTTSGKGLGLERLFLFGDANPANDMKVSLIGNLAGSPAILQAVGTAKFGRHGFKIGEMFLPSGFHVPAPSGERVIGGPGVGSVMVFIDIGAQLFGQYGWGGWSLSCVSGAGMNKPDNNKSKDLIAAFEAGGNTARLKLSIQGGQQPTGFRLLTSTVASLKLGPVDVIENVAWNNDAGAQYGGISSFIGWRATPRIDIALQHDHIHPFAETNYQRVALQSTLFGWNEKISLGLMGYWHTIMGFGSQMRLQFVF